MRWAILTWALMIGAFELGKHGQVLTVAYAYPPVTEAPPAPPPAPLVVVAEKVPCHPACEIWQPLLCR